MKKKRHVLFTPEELELVTRALGFIEVFGGELAEEDLPAIKKLLKRLWWLRRRPL